MRKQAAQSGTNLSQFRAQLFDERSNKRALPTLNAALITNDGIKPLSGLATGKSGMANGDVVEVGENYLEGEL